MENPGLSIIVPTRNRPDQVLACAASIIKAGGFLELVFVDQSDGPETAAALDSIGDPRVRCVRSSLRGATNGRNAGIDETSGQILAFTDDDCRVSPDWVQAIARIFDEDPQAAVICGRVSVPEEIGRQGFAAGFEPTVREWMNRFPPADSDWGLTANFAVRRSVLADVGKFDPILGVGAPLLAGEEPDLLIRVLGAGYKVVNAREVSVDHLGLRPHGEAESKLWRAYGVGTAAAIFKHVRLGNRPAAALYLEHLETMARVMFKNLRTGNRPLGLGYTFAFLSGAVASFKFRVNSRDRLYTPR